MARLVLHPAADSALSEDARFFERTCMTLWEEQRAQPSGVEVRTSTNGWRHAFKLGRGTLPRRFMRGLVGASSRSKLAFELALHLERAGVSTPRSLAYLERSFGPFVTHDALVMEFVEAPTLQDRLAEGSDAEAWLALAASTIYAMHEAGIRHRDLKASNLLGFEEQPGVRRALVVDLDGARLLKSKPAFDVRVRDLARLAVSVHLLGHSNGAEVAYAELSNWSREELEEAKRSIHTYEKLKRAANERRGRELT